MAAAAEPVFFETPAKFRAWLKKNSLKEPLLLVGFWRVGSGKPSMTWPESVDEALCFGWIDGIRKSRDADSYTIRFTPRREGSIWSAINIAKAKALVASGRMQPAGLHAFEARDEKNSAIYSYESRQVREFENGETRRFKASKVAWAYWQTCPPSYHRTLLHWVTSAKRPQTRERRLGILIEACEGNQRL